MVQAVQLSPVCRSRRRIGRPVATMVPSREDMKRAIDTIANTSQGALCSVTTPRLGHVGRRCRLNQSLGAEPVATHRPALSASPGLVGLAGLLLSGAVLVRLVALIAFITAAASV